LAALRPDEYLVAIGAVADEGRQHDSGKFAGDARYFVDVSGIEEIQIARFEADLSFRPHICHKYSPKGWEGYRSRRKH